TGNQPPIELTRVDAVGAERFKRRLYYLEPSMYENPPWDELATLADAYGKQKLKIVEWLFDTPVLRDFQVQTVYGLKDADKSLKFNECVSFGAAMLCAGACEWQKNGAYNKAKPVVIVNFDEFGSRAASQEPDVRTVLAGGFSVQEKVWKDMVE